MKTESNKVSELENRIFQYKLKEITAWKNRSFIIEVNGKTVSVNRSNTMVLSNDPYPTEFSNVELHQVKKVITGAEPIVYSVRDWYKNQLKRLSVLLIAGREVSHD